MHTLTAIALGLALIAVAAAVWFWLPWFRAGLSHKLFADAVIRLVKGDNLDRARKLTMAAPSSPFATAVRAALDAAISRSDPKSAFDEALRPEVARLNRGQFFALASAISSALCTVLVIEYASQAALIGPAVSIALIVHAYRIAKSIAVASSVEADRIFAVMAERATN